MCAFRGDVMVFPQQGRNGTDCYTTRKEFLQDIHLSVSKRNELESSSSQSVLCHCIQRVNVMPVLMFKRL